MNTCFIKMCEKIILLDTIIRRGNTGNAKQICKRLNVTERCVYEYLCLLKSLGAKIKFNRTRNTYQYLEEGKMVLNFVK